ncbi:kielin/chordin-like protein isoform X1 [Cherax quadricarinatus]|uniref:kielin/chordin-like protein isoform X1 n=2 Tax=Cherax quadricarinatus TaxID=27406 RepID=UPI00387E904F
MLVNYSFLDLFSIICDWWLWSIMTRPDCLVLSLLLPLLLLPPSRPLPVQDELGINNGKPCINPEECCKFPMTSEEFLQCGREHGCYPVSCGNHGSGKVAVHEDCSGAWSCCRFEPESAEFNRCCERHGCYPLCDQSSEGCCYDDVMYRWGSVVEELPGLCLELVCAAQMSTTQPSFTAVIVPRKLPAHLCREVGCENYVNNVCVDATGLLRDEGAKWYPDECQECTCRGSAVLCTRLQPSCPPPPHSYCVEVPDTCCPRWKCSVPHGCVDGDGVHRREREQWQDPRDPCIQLVCTKGIIITYRVYCGPLPKIHQGCVAKRIDGQCCPRWKCPVDDKPSGATTSRFIQVAQHKWKPLSWISWKPVKAIQNLLTSLHGKNDPQPSVGECKTKEDVGKTLNTSDPCSLSVCTENGFQTKPVECSTVYPRHPNCLKYSPQGECCPKWNCSGCFDGDGNYYLYNHKWTTNQCATHECTEEGIKSKRPQCSLGPKPHDDCRELYLEGACCPEWSCSGCYKDGNYYQFGHEIRTENPCINLICTKRGLETKYKSCPWVPAPRSNCFEYLPEGQCCEKWNCSGCVAGGKYYPLHYSWMSSPCVTHKCTKDGIQTTTQQCYWVPPPHSGCQEAVVPGACCPEWSCSKCYKDGKYYEIGREMSTDNPCAVLKCTEKGMEIKRKSCLWKSAPEKNCFAYIPEGECCTRWNCSGCLHINDYYPLRHVWRKDPCTRLVCTTDGIKPIPEYCYSDPKPHHGCKKYTPEGACCPRWSCSHNITDLGSYPLLNGCVDDTGVLRKFGDSWFDSSDKCKQYICGVNGITENIVCSTRKLEFSNSPDK